MKHTADTVIIKVLYAIYLTESMGSAGAFCYLGETVFTMTEHQSVNQVKLEFQYGSHAGPGVFPGMSLKN